MAELNYVMTPFLTWFIVGVIKFCVNSIKARSLAFRSIGYGGFPSNHSAIVSSMVSLIGLREGVSTPAFGVALTLAFIITIDAHGLRRQMGLHARVINHFTGSSMVHLRERMGHSYIEIIGGLAVGFFIALGIETWAK